MFDFIFSFHTHMKTFDLNDFVVHFENNTATIIFKYDPTIVLEMKCDDYIENEFKGRNTLFLFQNMCCVFVEDILYPFSIKHKIVDVITYPYEWPIPIDACGFAYILSRNTIVNPKFYNNLHPCEYYLKHMYMTCRGCNRSKVKGVSMRYKNSEECDLRYNRHYFDPDDVNTIVYDDGRTETLTLEMHIEMETEYGELMGFEKLEYKRIGWIVN